MGADEKERPDNVPPYRRLKGDLANAVAHLRDQLASAETPRQRVNKTLVKQFNMDYVRFWRRSVDIAFYNGEKPISHLSIRPGIDSSGLLLTQLEAFTGKDHSLLRALQTSLSQCGDSAFLVAAATLIHCVHLEDVSHTVRRQSEGRIDMTIRATILLPDFEMAKEKGKQVILARQRVAVTFVLTGSQEDGWKLESAHIAERQALEWVIDIPLRPKHPELDNVRVDSGVKLWVCSSDNKRLINLDTDDPVEIITPLLKKFSQGEILHAMADASHTPLKLLRRMIAKETGREIISFKLENQRRVIRPDGNRLVVSKSGEGEVTFKNGETYHFPYVEDLGIMEPVYLCENSLSK